MTFNLEKETENASARMDKYLDTLKVKDLKSILKEKDISFVQSMVKKVLREKLMDLLLDELTDLSSNDENSELFPGWTFSLCERRVQWMLYHNDRNIGFGTVSEALEFQKNSESSPDDNANIYDTSCDSDDDKGSDVDSSAHSSSSDSSVLSRTEIEISNVDPKVHIGKSTFDFSMSTNQKVRGKHSRLGFRERIKMKQMKKIDEKNSKKNAEDEEKIKTLKCHDLFCCDAIDPVTKNQCIAGPFVSDYFLKRHKKSCEEGNSHHIFPSINTATCVLIDIQQGKTSPLCLACGAVPNRDDAAAGIYQVRPPKPIPECFDPSCVGHGCYRRDNKCWKHKNFRASQELLNDLEALFEDGENRSKGGTKKNAGKYNATEAVAVLKNMMDSNGRRKYRLNGPFGRLPAEKYVKSWFARRKNQGAKIFLNKGTSNQGNDKYSRLTIEELKDEFEKTFDCLPTRKFLCIKLLEIDDELKYDGHDNVYTGLKLDELEKECKSRNLPFLVGIKSLQIVLRSHTTKLNSKQHKSAAGYNDAVNVTDTAEEILLHRNKNSVGQN